MNLDDLDAVALGVALSRLPSDHVLLVAARAAVDIADARQDRARAMSEASSDVSAAAGRDLAERQQDAAAMWKARADAEGPDSRAAEKAREFSEAPPRDPAGSELDTGTASAVAEARAWAEARNAELAERQRAEDQARYLADRDAQVDADAAGF